MRFVTPDRTGTHVAAELSLSVGYLGLAVGVVVAHATPATGYELSIYAATPVAFWGGAGTALLVGLAVALSSSEIVYRWLGTALGGLATGAIAALPLVRGYTYYGLSDALTHLGWAKDVQMGHLAAPDLYYPGIHTAGLATSNVVGYPLPRGLLFVVFLLALSFVVFVPLAVRELSRSPDGLVVGAFAGFLLLPVNHIAINYMNPHPISGAVLFSPLVLFLLVRYLDSPADGRASARTGGLLALALAGVVLYHSMLASGLIAFMGAIALVQYGYRRFVTGGEYLAGRPIYGHTAFLVVAFALWNVRFETVRRTAYLMYLAIRNVFLGTSAAGAVVSQRSGSLSGVGASLLEIFVKLLLPSAVFALLAGLLVLASVVRWRDPSLVRVRLLGAGLAGVVLYSVPFLAGNVSRLFFRNLGFVMAVVTVLGALALVRVSNGVPKMTVPLGVGFAVLLALSVLVLFPSPYLYHPNEQVTDSRLTGYETAFEYKDPDVAFAGIRNGPQRYLQAVYGAESVPPAMARYSFYRNEGAVPGEELTDLPGYFEDDRYLVVTAADADREVEAYNELRYTREQLAAVDHQRGVSRVQTNGAFELYYVAAAPNGS